MVIPLSRPSHSSCGLTPCICSRLDRSTTPMRTYTNTHLTDSNCTSRYIFNRLLTGMVTDGTKTVLPANNQYDAG